MKTMSFESFKKIFKDSDRERILKDFYYNYQLLVELKEYRRIIKKMTNDTYIEPNNKEKRFIDKVIELDAGEIIEDTPKEDKKIEKLNCKYTSDVSKLKVANKVDEIIELLNNSVLLSETEVVKFLDKAKGEDNE